MGRPGEDIAVPFYPSDEWSKEIVVDVDTGDTLTTERVTVRAGQPSSRVI